MLPILRHIPPTKLVVLLRYKTAVNGPKDLFMEPLLYGEMKEEGKSKLIEFYFQLKTPNFFNKLSARL